MDFLWRLLKAQVPPAVRAIDAYGVTKIGNMHKADEIPNQDNFFVFMRPNLDAYSATEDEKNESASFEVFAAGVFDGHGPHGETAGALAAETMQAALNHLCAPKHITDLSVIVKKAFKDVALVLDSASCSADSGCTGTVVLVQDQDIVFGHIGDSTAMFLAKPNWRHGRKVRYETRQHRTSDAEEASRVKSAGGVIQHGYVCDEDITNGIAVTRTLGDRDMRQYGCIAEPDIRQFKLGKRDSAIVIASDGLWDIPSLDVGEVTKIAVQPAQRNAKGVCEKIMGLTEARGGPSDDCTVLCITFD